MTSIDITVFFCTFIGLTNVTNLFKNRFTVKIPPNNMQLQLQTGKTCVQKCQYKLYTLMCNREVMLNPMCEIRQWWTFLVGFPPVCLCDGFHSYRLWLKTLKLEKGTSISICIYIYPSLTQSREPIPVYFPTLIVQNCKQMKWLWEESCPKTQLGCEWLTKIIKTLPYYHTTVQCSLPPPQAAQLLYISTTQLLFTFFRRSRVSDL